MRSIVLISCAILAVGCGGTRSPNSNASDDDVLSGIHILREMDITYATIDRRPVPATQIISRTFSDDGTYRTEIHMEADGETLYVRPDGLFAWATGEYELIGEERGESVYRLYQLNGQQWNIRSGEMSDLETTTYVINVISFGDHVWVDGKEYHITGGRFGKLYDTRGGSRGMLQ